MPPKIDTTQEIITQLALLNEQFLSLKNSVEKWGSDHETRIRTLEDKQNKVITDISTIRERMTIFNLMQGTLTAIAATMAYYFKK